MNSSHGGPRTGAGRKPGAASKKTRAIADKAAEDGVTPLEFMLKIMREEPAGELDAGDMLRATMLRFEAAKAAAPYIHPRLAAHDVSLDATVTTRELPASVDEFV